MRRSLKFIRAGKSFPFISTLLAIFLFCQPAFLLVGNAQAPAQRSARQRELTEDQRIAHVLSRLTFGARPGDVERIKAAGIDEFIRQQLDPDSIDDHALQAKLAKLPTLNMATPVIIEQYTPPKPAAVPSPTPKPADTASPSPQKIAQNPLVPTPQLSTSPNPTAMQTEMQMEAKKNPTAETQKPEAGQNNAAAPKPTPPPKNPQMVVTELQR